MSRPPITFMDGFDTLQIVTMEARLTSRWSALPPSVGGTVYANGRNGGGGRYLSGNNRLYAPLTTNASGVMGGVAINASGVGLAGVAGPRLFSTGRWADAAESLSLTVDASRRLRVVRGATTLLVDATGRTLSPALSPTSWQYVEWWAEASATVGRYTVAIDGTVVLEDLIGQNLTGGIPWDWCSLGDSANFTFAVDDCYLCDLTGTSARDFHGDLTIRAIPAVALGARQEWAASGDPDKLADLAQDAGGGVNAGTILSGGVGSGDLYTFDAGAIGGAPRALAVVAVSRKDDAGPRTLRAIARAVPGSTDVDAATNQTLTAEYRVTPWIYPTDPTRGSIPWTIGNVADTQFGLEVAS